MDRFPYDRACRQKQQYRVGKCRKDRRTAEAVSEFFGRCPRGKTHGTPRQQKPNYIAEIVPGVRQQGERVGPPTETQLDKHKTQIERSTNRKNAVGIGQMVVMAVVRVMVCVVACVRALVRALVRVPVFVIVFMRMTVCVTTHV
jgi:hypothetical protein